MLEILKNLEWRVKKGKMNDLLETALTYAKLGYKVFPLTPLSKIPLKGTRGSKEATTHLDRIKQWWGDEPQANIGLVTDKFIVLDVDRHDSKKNGYTSLETLENTFKKLPHTSTVQTANDGLHIYLKKPKGVHLPQKIALLEGLDIKAHPNNYVVAPPSIIKKKDGSTGHYTVKDKSKMADCPQWLIDYILRDTPKSSQAVNVGGSRPNRYRNKTTQLLERLVEGAETGNRNDTIARTTGQLLTYGVKIPLAWELIQFMNGNSAEPLGNKELETTFLSICKRELRDD